MSLVEARQLFRCNETSPSEVRTSAQVCSARSFAACDPEMQQHQVFVEPCWWLHGRSTSLYRCGMYRVNDRLEIRVSSAQEGVVYLQVVRDVEAGRALAHACHARMLATGRFEPLWT